jgi:hypothetical protein
VNNAIKDAENEFAMFNLLWSILSVLVTLAALAIPGVGLAIAVIMLVLSVIAFIVALLAMQANAYKKLGGKDSDQSMCFDCISRCLTPDINKRLGWWVLSYILSIILALFPEIVGLLFGAKGFLGVLTPSNPWGGWDRPLSDGGCQHCM